MRFSVLLFALAQILKIAAWRNPAFKKALKNAKARILIKTADNQRGRLFVFDKGRVYSKSGVHSDYDAALVWKDAATGFSVMTDKRTDASFNAAAEGKLHVEGMGVYAQWFEETLKLVL